VKKILESFQRIMSSGCYIAEIDGLRLVAIFSVIVCRLRGVFIAFSGKHSLYAGGAG
jgi:hypothetical protein